MRVRGTPHPEMVTADRGRFRWDGEWVVCSGRATARRAGSGEHRCELCEQCEGCEPCESGQATHTAAGDQPELDPCAQSAQIAIIPGEDARSRIVRFVRFVRGRGDLRRQGRGRVGGAEFCALCDLCAGVSPGRTCSEQLRLFDLPLQPPISEKNTRHSQCLSGSRYPTANTAQRAPRVEALP